MTNEMLFRFEKSQPHNIARPIPQVLKGAENANRATIISCSKPRRNAAVNMGTTVFARHGRVMGLAYILAPLSGKIKCRGCRSPTSSAGPGCNRAFPFPLISSSTTRQVAESRQEARPFN